MPRFKVRDNRTLRLPSGDIFAKGGDVFELPDNPAAVALVLHGRERLVRETDEDVTPGLSLPPRYLDRIRRLPVMERPKAKETPGAVRKTAKLGSPFE